MIKYTAKYTAYINSMRPDKRGMDELVLEFCPQVTKEIVLVYFISDNSGCIYFQIKQRLLIGLISIKITQSPHLNPAEHLWENDTLVTTVISSPSCFVHSSG